MLNSGFQDFLKVNVFHALKTFFRNGIEDMSLEPEAWSLKRLINDFDSLKNVLKPGIGDILETSLEAHY